MTNSTLLLLCALADILFVFIVARRQPARLFGVIAINLILITIFGAKLISVFGFDTNAGNIFYACVFLATHFLLERQTKEQTYEVIWFGSVVVIFFIALSQLAVHVSTVSSTRAVSDALQLVFDLSPRIALASILSYIFAQFLNIRIYSWIQEKTQGRFLWLRSNGANIIAQLVDSCFFFTIAFIDLPGTILVQSILSGWLIKTCVVILGTPFLYVDNYFLNKKK